MNGQSDLLKIIASMKEALAGVPSTWDARAAIQEMRDAESRHWKQMEWIGFYFEFLCERHLSDVLEMPGPRYGKVGFDGFAVIPWDCKAHAINTSSHEIIVNDSEATSKAIAASGAVGLILAVGKVEYNDENRTFQAWHETFKGGPSKYTKKRVERGAWSRLRKTQLDLEEIHFIKLTDATLVKCGSFQENFRNADGSPRRKKVLLDLEKLDEEIIETIRFK